MDFQNQKYMYKHITEMLPEVKKYCEKNLFLFWNLESHRREEDDQD